MTVLQLSTGPPHFLLVEDDDRLAAAFRRVLARYGVVSVADSVAVAFVAIDTMALTGVVSDVSLPDGSGIDVAARARARTSDLPILLVSGAVDHWRLGAAHELGAAFLLKPVDTQQLAHFAERAVARQRRAATLFEEWGRRYGFTAAEAVTLRLALGGMRRDEIASARGVRAVTVRNQIAGLVAKVGAPTVAECVALFYRELWAGDR